MKIKESVKSDKYLDLARELRKLRNMKVKMIPTVIRVLWMIPKGLEREHEEMKIEGRTETIQTIAILRSASIPRRILETWRDSDSCERPSANAGVKDSQEA